MSIGLEDYGYPRVDFTKDKTMRWVRVTHGWFFWDDDDDDEEATYLETWVDEHLGVDVVLESTCILFDFVTPLDEYLLPGSKTMTIGDLYKEEIVA